MIWIDEKGLLTLGLASFIGALSTFAVQSSGIWWALFLAFLVASIGFVAYAGLEYLLRVLYALEYVSDKAIGR